MMLSHFRSQLLFPWSTTVSAVVLTPSVAQRPLLAAIASSSLRRCGATSTTSKNNSFAPFSEGSRRCTIDVTVSIDGENSNNNNKKKNVCVIDIVPIAHAAVPEFYDHLLQTVDTIRQEATGGLPIEQDYLLQQQEEDADTKNKKFITVVEGASETPEERQLEKDELAQIHHHVRVVAAAQQQQQQQLKEGDEDSSSSLPPHLQQSINFLTKFRSLIESGAIYNAEAQQGICQMYRLPYPLPSRLVLQDVYFRPRLALRHGDCIVNGDAVVSEMQNPDARSGVDAVAFHRERELSCAKTVMGLVKEAASVASAASGSSSSSPSQLSFTRRIVVLWGHYHCPNFLPFLTAHAAMLSSSSSTTGSGVITLSEPRWSSTTTSYGWTKDMMLGAYGTCD